MAHVSETRTGIAEFGASNVVARIREAADTLTTRFAQYRTYRITLGELRNLSTRELDDLGINQEYIRDIAWNAATK